MIDFRNENGGSLLFRPVGQRPFVLCALALYDEIHDMDSVMKIMNKIDYSIGNDIWKYIVWNPISKNMITSSNGALIERMLKYFVGIQLSKNEFNKLLKDFQSMKGDENLTESQIIEKLDQHVVIHL